MPAHRAAAGRSRHGRHSGANALSRHRLAYPSAPPAPPDPRPEGARRPAQRWAAVVGTIAMATIIALIQAPAVELAAAYAGVGQETTWGGELASVKALARIGVPLTPAARQRDDAAAELERASRSAQRDPRALARLMAARQYGWSGAQWECLQLLWTQESSWNYRAENPSSGAYGIAQALPATKMNSIARDWRVNPVTQISWGLRFIQRNYGSPCSAWDHEQGYNWY